MPGGGHRARADAGRAGNLVPIVANNIINLDRVNKGYGAAGQLLTDVSLGPWRFLVMACLVLAPVLAVLAAPWLFVAAGHKQVRGP